MRVWLARYVLFVLTGALALTGAAPALARTAFDGPWSVIVMTQSGTCDPAYRYAVLVADGRVVTDAAESSGLVGISGSVAADGKVTVNVQRGGQQANGTGRLAENSGAGTWTGKASGAVCAGRWEAKRN